MCDNPKPTIWYAGTELEHIMDVPESQLDAAQDIINLYKVQGVKVACTHHGNISHLYRERITKDQLRKVQEDLGNQIQNDIKEAMIDWTGWDEINQTEMENC